MRRHISTVAMARQDSAMRQSVEAIIEEKGVELTKEEEDSLYEYIIERTPPRMRGRVIVKGPFFSGFYDDFFENLGRP